MRNIILQIDVTLDGFVADSDGKNFWASEDAVMNADALDLLEATDTIMLGRVAYQQFVQFWPTAELDADSTIGKIAAQINHATKLVFSRTLDSAAWGKWNNAQVVNGNIAEEIARLKAQPGKNLLLYAGAGIVSEFMRLGLIDEYRLRIHPVVLGDGLPLFGGVEPRQMKLLETKAYGNGVMMLVYVPAEK